MITTEIKTMGVDVGSSNIKTVLVDYSHHPKIIDKHTEKIRKRNPVKLSEECVGNMLKKWSQTPDDIAYLASTGEGEMVEKKNGHFYTMTTHARGAYFFYPEVKTIIDLGALYVKVVKIGDKGKVIDYKMTGQCASGSGQFLENISRYMGLSIEEVGDISLKSDVPEISSGICAVLAETDVINMISRGITTPNIIKGIHLSIAQRVVKLLASLKVDSPTVLTGGMALNIGMVEAIKEVLFSNKIVMDVKTHPDSIYAGAIGAALWGGFRYLKLKNESLKNADTLIV